MKTQHTKGEWTYSTGGVFDKPAIKVGRPEGDITIAIFDMGHIRDACIRTGNRVDGITLNHDEANARLCAAAPELLEQCYVCKAIFDSLGIDENHEIIGRQYKELINTIKKATE